MKFHLLYLLSFFLFQHVAFAQHQIVEIPIENYIVNEQSISGLKTHTYAIQSVPNVEQKPFLSVAVVWEAEVQLTENQRFWIGFGSQNGAWSNFQDIKKEEHSKKIEGRFVSQLMFVEEEIAQFRLYFQTPENEAFDFTKISVHFYHPKESDRNLESAPRVENRLACVCPQPDFLDREGWCPDGTCPEDNTPAFTNVTHLIVHHTAGSNTSSDWAARVRSIWNFHVNTNGWDDIGYNWLIDPEGTLYQGRGDNVRGAHFCGTNTNTVGVAMIGDFQNGNATEAAKETLKALLAWKSCDVNVDPLATAFHPPSNLTLNHISGHRDGCATTCPGDNFYPELPTIRQDVLDIRENDCDAKLDAPILAGTAISDFLIDLTWNDDNDEEDEFVIERSVGTDDNFVVLATVPANTTMFTDNSVMGMMTYFYRIRALSDDILDSDFSNEVEVSTDFSSTRNLYLNTETVQIFPNPNNGKFQLTIENSLLGSLQIELLDFSGKLLYQENLGQKTTEKVKYAIDLPGIPAGTYFLGIQQADNRTFFGIIID